MKKQELVKAFRDCAEAMSRVVSVWDDETQAVFDNIFKNESLSIPSFDDAVGELTTLADGFDSYRVSVFDLVDALQAQAVIACEVTFEYPNFALITLPIGWQFSVGTANRDEVEQFGWDGTTTGLGHDVAFSDSVGYEVTSASDIARVIWSQILSAISTYIRNAEQVGK